MTEQDQAKRLRQLYEKNNRSNKIELRYEEDISSSHSRKKSHLKIQEEDLIVAEEIETFPSRKQYHSKDERKKRKQKEKEEQKKKNRFNIGFFLRLLLAVVFLSLPFAIWYVITQEEPVFKEESLWYEKVTIPFVAKTNETVTKIPLEKVEDEEEMIEEEQEKIIVTVRFHTVQSGETLASISKLYYDSTDYQETIIAYNNLTSKKITTGQVLSIPIKETYIIEN